MEAERARIPSREEIEEESRRIRRLRIAVHLALSCIAHGGMPLEEALGLEEATRKVALKLFPGKGPTFDLIYAPKFERMIREVYGQF
ncbi:MAG TPA: hypothetical protein VJX29_08075 [Candidatus Acidoferrales bacterium]|nr:hypothetical protein [Candidatus Acidoferrales bacterium]